MHLFRHFLYAISLVAILGFNFASAQETDKETDNAVEKFRTPVIAIIEYGKIERGSKAWKDFSKQFEKVKDDYQADVKKQQDGLQEQQQQLQKQSTVLSPESFAAEEKKFREAVLQLQRQTDERKRNLDNVFNKARNQFRVNIATIAAEVAREREVDIVLNTTPNDATLFFWSDNLSITDEVLKRFDEKFPNSLITIEDKE